jgi:hypothetical protein
MCDVGWYCQVREFLELDCNLALCVNENRKGYPDRDEKGDEILADFSGTSSIQLSEYDEVERLTEGEMSEI